MRFTSAFVLTLALASPPALAVAQKYWYQCYLIQTAAILPTVSGDISRTAQACSRARRGGTHRSSCCSCAATAEEDRTRPPAVRPTVPACRQTASTIAWLQ